MKNCLWLLAALLCAGFTAGCAPGRAKASMVAAATTTKPPSGWSKTIVLWPDGAPGALGSAEGDVPKLYAYPVEENKHPHAAVIVIPGGGYVHLATEKEGGDEARWLNRHGLSAFVLEYRLGPRYHFPAPMLDGSRAVRYVRAHAREFGVDPSKVGLWGFSAGAHLAGYLATVHDAGAENSPDPVERVSDRPDFAIVSYGRFSMDPSIPRKTNMEGLLGNHPTQKMLDSISIVRLVNRTDPPFFIYSTSQDQTVNPLNATALYDVLQRAGVPAELHIFEQGPHGSAMAQYMKKYPELMTYPTLLENWMELHGWM